MADTLKQLEELIKKYGTLSIMYTGLTKEWMVDLSSRSTFYSGASAQEAINALIKDMEKLKE